MLQVRKPRRENLLASHSVLMREMADHRPKITSSDRSQGGKRRASVLAFDASNIAIQPSPQHAISSQDGHGVFQVPSLPVLSMSGTHAPKVAIPRLRRESDAASATGPSRSGDKHRISHACEPCRSRKTKCSGEKPKCRHCQECQIECIYGDGKRDKAKKSVSLEVSWTPLSVG